MKHGYLRPIPENAKKLVNDVGKISGQHKEKLDYCYTENFLVVQIPRGIRIELPDSGHSHDAYEFIIPREPMPYLVRENSIYFGEVGKIYPVQSGLSHRIKYKGASVKHTNIVVAKPFMEQILKDKGIGDYQFHTIFSESQELHFMVEIFQKEFLTKSRPDSKHKLEPLSHAIVAEIIDLSVQKNTDDRKFKSSYQKGVHSVAEYIDEHFNKDMTLEELADICELSPNYFSTCFRKTFGDPPKIYITKLRVSKAKTMLATTKLTITEVGKSCGFKTLKVFSDTFRKYSGMSPKAYRHQYEQTKKISQHENDD